MLKFLSIATLVGAALVLSSGDASATFFRKKKKQGCCPAPVAAPCCGGGGYHAGAHPGAPYTASIPFTGQTGGFATTEFVPTPMPTSGTAVIVPATYQAPAVQAYPSTIPVGPAIYTEPVTTSKKKRLFRR